MIGSTIASYPNRVYICDNCGKHLGDRYSRLKGKKGPSVIIINGVSYCNRCADKHLIAVPGGISGEKGGQHRGHEKEEDIYHVDSEGQATP